MDLQLVNGTEASVRVDKHPTKLVTTQELRELLGSSFTMDVPPGSVVAVIEVRTYQVVDPSAVDRMLSLPAYVTAEDK